MSMSVAARKKKGSKPSALGAAAAATPVHMGGRGSRFSAPTALSLGHGGGSVPMALSLGRGGGSAPTTHSFGCGGSSAAVTRPTMGGLGKNTTTTPSSIDGSSVGAFPSSSLFMDGFPFSPSSSPTWCDAAGSDPSSPGFGRSTVWDASW